VSETALGFTITAAKNFYALNQLVHDGGWKHDRRSITELFDITVGVVGCGFAGAHYIELLQPFDVTILAYDPYQDEVKIRALGAQKADMERILRESDIISLHAPSIPETRHMINADTLSQMKDNVILINTARGSLIDEAALYAHMAAGKIKYACLDVTDPEPPRSTTRCARCPTASSRRTWPDRPTTAWAGSGCM
jgi:phosphoglycerate dehydrogenase-like enzyme